MKTLTVFLMLAAQSYAGSWVIHNINASTTGSTTLAVSAGDLIVAFAATAGSSVPVISDGVNTYTAAVSCNVSTRPSGYVISRAVAVSTATVTITNSLGDSIHAANFTHTDGAMTGAVNGTATGCPAGVGATVTTTVANTLLVGFNDASVSNVVGAGFTVIGQTASSVRVTSEYQLTNSAGSNQILFTSTGGTKGYIGAAFTPPVAGGYKPPRRVTVGRLSHRPSLHQGDDPR